VRASRKAIAVVALLATCVSGCFRNSYDVQCTPQAGAIQLAWTPDAAFERYRVYRIAKDEPLAAIGEATGGAWTDPNVQPGTRYNYVLRAIDAQGAEVDADAGGVGACAVVAESAGDLDPVGPLTCRAKSGKVDVAWEPVAGAIGYRVLRGVGAATSLEEIGEIAGSPFADLGVVDGTEYQYAVVAVGGDGATAAPSSSCFARPGPNGGGDPPPAVAAPSCRGKRDKVDVTWTEVAGAAFYRVLRSAAGGGAVPVGEVVHGVFADFGLAPGVPHAYSIRAVAADGTEAPDSPTCEYTASDDGEGNLPPQISSAPVTNALEQHFYEYPVSVSDPEGQPVALSVVQGPPGMFVPSGTTTLLWTPGEPQIGPHTVALRATDPAGAYATQAFVVIAADWNEPPRITSVPVRSAEVGQPYEYDVEAFDPESAALSFSFAVPPPAGMSIDAASGRVSWTPTQPLLGQTVVVRAADAGGAFEDQSYALDATQDPLVLASPDGTYQVAVGETLELRFESNYAGARYFAGPLPPGITRVGDLVRFSPEPGQAGRYDLIAKASFGSLRDANAVSILVTDTNAPPVFGALGPFEVAEGGTLRFAVAATDPDGDALSLSAPALALDNAFFDEFSGQLVFEPSFEQAGSYDLVFRASDGTVGTDAHVAVTVTDAEPPIGALDLVVNPPQSPTFVARQTISGSVTGEVASGQAPAAPLVTGLAPTNAQQGRPASVSVTGRNTRFVEGEIGADFGEGISVDSITVTSPTQATIHVTVSPTAPLGVRQPTVQSEGQEIPSVVAFRVEPGAAVVRGRLVDSFTGEALVGVRVNVNGTSASAVTGADGSFEIVGVPAGAQTLVALAPNFDVLELDVAVEQNATYTLDEPLGMVALARPARPGGSLPRAQTLASILDRGVSTIDQPISQEEAELLVSDTMIAIGGNQAGVVDENGVQLNPRLVGPGILSLTPESVSYFARHLVQGQVFTLEQVAYALQAMFGWIFSDLDFASVRLELQTAVNRAWRNASDPAYALPIVIFNPGGTTLSGDPPVLTADTRLNFFQAFLLFTSFAGRNMPAIDEALDVRLQTLGIDPRELLQEAGVDGELYGAMLPHERPHGGAVARLAQRAAGWAGVVGDLTLGASAYAQTGGSGHQGRDLGGLSGVYDTLWTNGRSTYSGAFQSGIFGVALAGGIALALALCGFAAPLAAFSVIGTFIVGFLTTVFAKCVGAFFQDRNLPANYTPRPPAAVSQVDPTVDEPNFYLRFQRSLQDIQSDQLRREHPDYSNLDLAAGWLEDVFVNYASGRIDRRLLNHRYFLWKYACNPDADDCRARHGDDLRGRSPFERETLPAHVDPLDALNAPRIEDPNGILGPRRSENADFEQFRILKTRLQEGSNYFRIQTMQFYRRLWNGINPDEEFIGVELASLKGALYDTTSTTVDGMRGNFLGEISRLEVEQRAEHKSAVAEGKTAQLEQQRQLARQKFALQERARYLDAQQEAQLHRVGAEAMEKEAKDALDVLNGRLDDIAPRIRAHYDLASAVEIRLGSPPGSANSPLEIVRELTDPTTPRGAELASAASTRSHDTATP
jgi:hypothetical protein